MKFLYLGFVIWSVSSVKVEVFILVSVLIKSHGFVGEWRVWNRGWIDRVFLEGLWRRFLMKGELLVVRRLKKG